MAVLFAINDPLIELVRQYDLTARQLELATTQKDRRYYNGRLSGFREAIETIDVYLRYLDGGCNIAVELRNAKDIIEEVRRNAS